jgi:hypothetical protein
MPELVHLTQVFDEDGNRVRVGYGAPIVATFPSWEAALTDAKQAEVLKKLKSGNEVPLAENFLRDARYINSKNGDPAQIILFLAIACEVNIKTRLTDIATKQQAELLRLVINRPPIVGLFDKTAKAIKGKSLRDENKGLYDKVDVLFQDRNKIAHHGIVPTHKIAQGHISAAIDVFEWVKTL